MIDHDHNWYGTVCLVCGIENIDAALATVPPATETATSTATVRKCKRHQWTRVSTGLSVREDYEWCPRCGTVLDPIASRRGKSNARLGKDQERRAERRYGWEKIGERGEKTDLRGTFAKVQMKASRRPVPALIRDTFAGLDATKDGRVALLLLSYIQPSGTSDYVVIRGEDWLQLHGRDEPDVG
jgi:ribosomal protein L34E